MVVPFIRTLILYFLVILAIRLMGKRQVGEMQPTELVITILVSAVASVPMQNLDIPLSFGVVPIMVLISAEIFMSFLSLKFPKFRYVLTGKPVIVISDGKINQQAMKDMRFNNDDLLEVLRLRDVFDLRQVRKAQIETNGQVSLILYSQFCQPTAKEMKVPVKDAPYFYSIISDGRVNKNNLSEIGKDDAWLHKQLQKNSVQTPSDVYLMLSDIQSNVVFYPKTKDGA